MIMFSNVKSSKSFSAIVESVIVAVLVVVSSRFKCLTPDVSPDDADDDALFVSSYVFVEARSDKQRIEFQV